MNTLSSSGQVSVLASVPMHVTVTEDDFDLSAEVAALRAGDGGAGAVVAFVGTVRDRNDGHAVQAMALEHYPGMTERSIGTMAEAAVQRFGLRAVRVIHRVGLLQPLDQIVLVAVSAAHRRRFDPDRVARVSEPLNSAECPASHRQPEDFHPCDSTNSPRCCSRPWATPRAWRWQPTTPTSNPPTC